MIGPEVQLFLHLLSISAAALGSVAVVNHAVQKLSGTTSLVQIKFINKIYREIYTLLIVF